MAIVLPKLSRRRPASSWTAHSAPTLTVTLCRADAAYRMGQPLAGRWQLSKLADDVEIDGLEASVLWYTEGKGDEDQHVHHFRRWSSADLATMDLDQTHPWDCQLPLTPLSYEGTLLRIRWCVRLRLFCRVGRDTVAQVPFRLLPDVVVTDPVAAVQGDAEGLDLAAKTQESGSTQSPLTGLAAQPSLVARVGQFYRRRQGRWVGQR